MALPQNGIENESVESVRRHEQARATDPERRTSASTGSGLHLPEHSSGLV